MPNIVLNSTINEGISKMLQLVQRRIQSTSQESEMKYKEMPSWVGRKISCPSPEQNSLAYGKLSFALTPLSTAYRVVNYFRENEKWI